MSNKENVTTNKFEGPKLNMEPVQMKKKKKGGGYNLRKSLAWNRAFFTEEGVLDDVELSMISGTLGNSSNEGLSAIKEEAIGSLSDDCQVHIESSNLQALEKNLFKEAPAVCLRKDIETVCSPPKRTSPARTQQTSTSMASHKVLSTHVPRRTGSKPWSSPRPFPSSSKRPANSKSFKAVIKESKLSQLPVSKRPGHPSSPVVRVQKNLEMKSCAKSVKMTQNKSKASYEPLLNKSSASNAKRNKVNPPINLHAPIQECPEVDNKVDNFCPKVTLDGVTPSVRLDSFESQAVNSQHAASVPSRIATGRSLQPTQTQPTKPSGLRMPSPSLKFFDQSKPSISHRFSRRVFDSNHRVGKSGDWRPQKILEAVKSNMLIENAVVSNSRYGSNAVSNQKITQDVGKGARKGAEKVSHEQNCVPSALDANRVRIECKNTCEEKKSGNFAVIDLDASIESQTVDESNSSDLNSVSCLQDLHQPSCLQTDSSETSTVEEILVPDADKPPSVIEESPNLIRDLQNCATEKNGSKNLETSEPTNFKLENSAFSSQDVLASQSEDSLMRNDITDNSLIKETVLQIPNMIPTPRRCKDCLKQSLEVGDLDITSGKVLESQTACLEVDQISNIIHGLPAGDCLFLEKDIGSKQCQKEVIETFPLVMSDERVKSEIHNSGAKIAEIFGGMEGEIFDTGEMAGEGILMNPMLGSVEVYPPVASHDGSFHTIICSDASLSCEAISLDLHSCPYEASEFLVAGGPGFYGNKLSWENKKDSITSEPAHQISFDGPYLESQILDVNQTSLSSESKVCEEEQKIYLQNIVETDSSLHDSFQIELEKFSTLPQVALVLQINEAGKEAANMSNISQTGNNPEHLGDGIVPVQCCIGNTLVACGQYVAGANFTVESEKTELPNSCTFVEEASKYNNELLLGNCLYEETTEFEKSKKSSVLEIGQDVITDASLSPLPSKVNGLDVAKFSSGSCNAESRPRCMEIEPSSDKCKLFGGNRIRHFVDLGGLVVEGDLTSPRSLNQSVQLTNSATDENNPEVCQDTDNLPEGTNCDLDTSSCQQKVENATVPIGSKKPVTTSNKTNLMILPPRNAVPFSDEWLAAIEAAGEEILTMKSGAVQNSPPDKSLPEPSPWSPVKRKNTSIGPYDCTKFTNDLSSDPQ